MAKYKYCEICGYKYPAHINVCGYCPKCGNRLGSCGLIKYIRYVVSQILV